MPLVQLYFSPALLLLVLTCPLWQPGQSLPVSWKGPVTDSCVSRAWTLLESITQTLEQTDLFSGFNCTEQIVELNVESNTPSVCAPKVSTCAGTSGQSTFDQDSCLTNIREDLRHYYMFFAAQPRDLFMQSPLSSIKELMQTCFTYSLPNDVVSEEGAADRPATFGQRLSLCKKLKGFHVRTITINRAMAYINSGEHAK